MEKELILFTSVGSLDGRQNMFGFCDTLDLAVAEDFEYVEFASSGKKSAQSLILSRKWLHLGRCLKSPKDVRWGKICILRVKIMES